MNWRNLLNRLRGRPRTLERDLEDELAFHREMKEREYRNQGLGEEDARMAARRSLGNLTLAREQARETWQFTWLADLVQDLRYGLRSLAAQPAFTAAAIVALTVGIGLNGILFSVYNALALAPWAIRDPARAVQVLSERRPGRWNGVSWPEYRYLRDKSRTMEALTAWDTTGVRVTRGDTSWEARGVAAGENFFDAIGTGFAAGRGFSPSNGDLKNPSPEVVLHYDIWQSRFGGDKEIVGQWLELNGHRLQVVGVAAQGFAGPMPAVPDLWIPAPWRDIFHPNLNTIDTPNSCCAQMIGRLRADTARAAARAELETLSAQFRQSVRQETTRLILTDPAFLADPTMHSRASAVFLVLAVAALLILLLACANVANLLLARGAARRREIAVRLSLGAGRSRILRQLLAESLLLSLLAGALTVAIAAWLPGAIMRWAVPAEEKIAFRFAVDWRVVVFVLSASFVTTLLFALAPAAAAVRDGLATGVREAGSRATSGNRLRPVLLAAQVALCATLLSGATLLLRAMQQARGIDPGFRHEDVILLSTGLQSSGVSDEQSQGPIALLRERLGSLPGVVSVAYASMVPLGNSFDATSVPDPRSRDQVMTGFTRVSAGFFGTLGIPLLAGRTFTPADEGRTDVAIVNEDFAARLWPGENPLGKSIPFMRSTLEVVGVARNISTRELGGPGQLDMYVPSKGTRGVHFFIRHTGPASPLLSEMPKLARQIDRRFFATAVPYTDNVERARRSAAIAASFAGVFSLIALSLAFVGLYAVAAYHVAQRTREIGVRMALGATPPEILRLVTGQNLRPVIVGSLLGIGGAIALARLLTSLLYGISPTDPRALLLTVLMLALTVILATWRPARRATSLDPSLALRHE